MGNLAGLGHHLEVAFFMSHAEDDGDLRVGALRVQVRVYLLLLKLWLKQRRSTL